MPATRTSGCRVVAARRRSPSAGALAAGACLRGEAAAGLGTRQLPRVCWRGIPSRSLEHDGRTATAGELAAAELARPIYASIVAERPEPPTPLPLFRRWHWQPRGEASRCKTLVACGVAPSLDCGRVFLVEKTGLRLLDPETGAPRWSVDLGAPPVWAGLSLGQADRGDVAPDRGARALAGRRAVAVRRRRRRARTRVGPIRSRSPAEPCPSAGAAARACRGFSS